MAGSADSAEGQEDSVRPPLRTSPWLRGRRPASQPWFCGCLRAGPFPSLGLRFHICTMSVVAMTIFRKLTTRRSRKCSHESVILILRNLLHFSTGEGLVYSFIQQTFTEHLLCTRKLGCIRDQDRHSPSWNLYSSV